MDNFNNEGIQITGYLGRGSVIVYGDKRAVEHLVSLDQVKHVEKYEKNLPKEGFQILKHRLKPHPDFRNPSILINIVRSDKTTEVNHDLASFSTSTDAVAGASFDH